MADALSVGGAEKVGQGIGKEEHEIPLDVNYSALAQWAVDRKRVSSDWRKRLSALQAKANICSQKLPPGTVEAALNASLGEEEGQVGLDYLRCRKLRDTLVADSENSRGMFGRLQGAAKDWDTIVRVYEKESLFIPEAAQTLMQGTDYDYPAFRKAAQRIQSQLSDYDRREIEAKQAVIAAAQAYKAACADWRISGTSSGGIRTELLSLVQELPGIWEDAFTKARADGVARALAYYDAFVLYAHAPKRSPQGGGGRAHLLPLLDLLQTADANTDMAVLGLEDEDTKPADTSVADAGFDLSAALAAGVGAAGGAEAARGPPAPVEINWDLDAEDVAAEAAMQAEELAAAGGAGTEEAGPAEISWDIDIDMSGQPTADTAEGPALVEINWDLDPAELEAEARAQQESLEKDAEAPAIEINWDFDVSAVEITAEEGAGEGDARAEGETPGWSISCTDGGEARAGTEAGAAGDVNGVGPPKSAVSIALSRAPFRTRMLNELLELRAFLSQRRLELRSASAAGAMGSSSAPEEVQCQTADSVAAQLRAVEAVISVLTARRTTDLLLIQSSGRYLDRLVRVLQQKAMLEGKLRASLADFDVKRAALRQKLGENASRMEAMQGHMRSVKAEVEKALSASLNRRVNIVGQINNCLH